MLSNREDLKVLVFLVVSMLFFRSDVAFFSFFVIIYLINKEGVSPDLGPNLFMIGLVPPTLATIMLYVKVFGRHLFSSKSTRTA